MAKFRTKPVEKEAWPVRDLLRDAASAWKSLPLPVVAAYGRGDVVFASDGILIRTLEGAMRADVGDMVICGLQGELYPCKPDIFEATYEPAR